MKMEKVEGAGSYKEITRNDACPNCGAVGCQNLGMIPTHISMACSNPNCFLYGFRIQSEVWDFMNFMKQRMFDLGYEHGVKSCKETGD